VRRSPGRQSISERELIELGRYGARRRVQADFAPTRMSRARDPERTRTTRTTSMLIIVHRTLAAARARFEPTQPRIRRAARFNQRR